MRRFRLSGLAVSPAIPLAALCVGLMAMAALAPAHATGYATNWQQGHKFKSRLLVGAAPGDGGRAVLVAGLEIVLEPGWKTYWRNPGDAGGIPPYFDWSKSRNLKAAKVMFPAPSRFVDATGTTIGYKKHVVFPVEITPQQPGRKVGIALAAEFGVCRGICIPARATHAIEIAPGAAAFLPPQLAASLAAVPRRETGATAKPDSPRLLSAKIEKTAKPRLVFEVAYPAGTAGADMFVEDAGGSYLPVVRPLGAPAERKMRFALDLSGDVPPSQIRGHKLRLTMVSDAANAETVIKLD